MAENEKNKDYIVRKLKSLRTKEGPRYGIVEAKTNTIVDDARGFGYKSEASARRGWYLKNGGMSAEKRKERVNRIINNYFQNHPGLKEDIEEKLFFLIKFDMKVQTREILFEFDELYEIDEPRDGFTVVELLNYLQS